MMLLKVLLSDFGAEFSVGFACTVAFAPMSGLKPWESPRISGPEGDDVVGDAVDWPKD